MHRELQELVRLTLGYTQKLKDAGVMSVETEKEEETLALFYSRIKNCRKCSLSKTRTNFVFGDGDEKAELIFVGEAPGHDEDIKGLPFVGRAGQLLNKIIESIGLKRDAVYICNVLKCRPPGNRAPLPFEITTCLPYLADQLSLLKHKKAICTLGLCAATSLLNLKLPMSHLRGKWYEYEGTPVMVTYHPAYLLRNPDEKRKVWQDMKKVRECLQKSH